MSSCPKILYVHHATGLGGASLSLLDLVRTARAQGYDPVLACGAISRELEDLFTGSGIEPHRYPALSRFPHTTAGWYPLYNPLAAFRLGRTVWNLRRDIQAAETIIAGVAPDIVHLNSLTLPVYAIAARNLGYKLVWHIREASVPGHLGLRRNWLRRLVTTLPDEAIFISAAERQALTGGQRGVVIPNYVDTARFSPAVSGAAFREQFHIAPHEKVIAFMGGRTAIKGVFQLLAALPLVKAAVPAAHLVIAGASGARSARLTHRLARALLPLVGRETGSQRFARTTRDLSAYVTVLPWVSDVPRMLAACDVLTFPSIEPHFARPVLEAGAMGKPVVASTIAGVTELVRHAETGMLVPPGDVAALAQALIAVLTDDDLAASLGEHARAHIVRHFSRDAVVPRIMGVYETLTAADEQPTAAR